MRHIILCLAVAFCFNNSLAHKESTHQYMTIEAYNLLKLNLGTDVPDMVNHLHTTTPASDGGPWQLPYITRGAYREDLEDPVYRLWAGNHPTLYADENLTILLAASQVIAIIDAFTNNSYDPFVSSSHFWRADYGDVTNTTMLAISPICDFWMRVPNSYQKILSYANGGWDLSVNLILYCFPIHSDGSGCCATQRAIVTFRYNSLRDLHMNRNLYVTKVTWLNGQQTIFNQPIRFEPSHWSSLNPGSYSLLFENIIWETLGRMCHLLQDATVPAHVHVDEHGPFSRGDSFESFMGSDRTWTGAAVNATVGPFIYPFGSGNPLHYLMYVSDQMADHFGSNGPYKGDGNNNIEGNPLPDELLFLNSVNLSSLGSPTVMTHPIGGTDLTNIRDKMIPQAIRATAGLLYWFAVETGIIRNTRVQNDFSGGTVIVDGLSYPSGKTLTLPIGSTLEISNTTPQSYANFNRHYYQWNKLNTIGQIVGFNTNITWPITVDGNYAYDARFDREFNLTLAPAEYIEGGSGGSYKVNGNSTGGSYSGSFIERRTSPMEIEAVPPAGWVFAYWSDNTGDKYTNPRNLIPINHTTISATFKKHLFTSSNIGTSTNNQRKIVQSRNGTYCTVYQSGNRIWFTKSSDGVNWSGDYPMSDGGLGELHTYPAIVAVENIVNVVWQSIEWSGIPELTGRIYLRRYNLYDNSWGSLEVIGYFWPHSENFEATPAIDAGNLTEDGTSDEKRIVWKDYDGIKIIDANNGIWGSMESVPGTHDNCYYPSITNDRNSTYAVCWEDRTSGAINIKYVETSTDGSTWNWTNAALVSPEGWYTNQRPSMTKGNPDPHCGARISIAWQGIDNVVEGVSVHVRQGNVGCNNWGNVTSFSMTEGGASPHPVIGSLQSDDKLSLVWNQGNDVYVAKYNGTCWSAPGLLATGTNGGTECSINSYTPSTVAALWRKPDGGITITTSGVNPGGACAEEEEEGSFASDSPTGTDSVSTVPFRHNRHGFVSLAHGAGVSNRLVAGSFAFEIAKMQLVTSEGTRNIGYADLASLQNNQSVLSSKPFRVTSVNSRLVFSGAAYGKKMFVPTEVLRNVNQPLGFVTLKETSNRHVRKEVWHLPFSTLAAIRDSTFGVFNTYTIDLSSLVGKELYAEVEMLGHARNIVPLVDDDYLILRGGANTLDKMSGAGNAKSKSIPRSYALYQNYPNPFNPATTIRFDLPEDQVVSLKVFNVLGQQVAELAHGALEAGEHSVTSEFGHLPSGMYIYKLSAGKFNDVKKLLLVK